MYDNEVIMAILILWELYEYLSSDFDRDMLGYLRNEICTMHLFLQKNIAMLKQKIQNRMQKWWYFDCLINKWPSNLMILNYAVWKIITSSIVKSQQIWTSFIYETIQISSFLHMVKTILFQHCHIFLQKHVHRTYLVA